MKDLKAEYNERIEEQARLMHAFTKTMQGITENSSLKLATLDKRLTHSFDDSAKIVDSKFNDFINSDIDYKTSQRTFLEKFASDLD